MILFRLSYANDFHSKKIEILNDERDVYYLEGEKLEKFKNSIMVKNDLIKKWVYLPKIKQCMSKARITNYAATLSKSDNLFFLDDDNYFLSDNSINEIINLFKKYDFIVGQIMDNNKKVRTYKNGVLKTYAYPLTTAFDKVKIGMNRLGGGGWYGLIDDVRIYNRALTEDEIVELYESYE